MGTNSKFAIAIHALSLMAGAADPISSHFIANSANNNPVTIRKVLGYLSHAGFIHTQLGVDGGATLAMPPAQISLLAVYHATEQGPIFALHPTPPNGQCPCGRNIIPVLDGIFGQAEQAMQAVLGETTLADVLQQIDGRLQRETT